VGGKDSGKVPGPRKLEPARAESGWEGSGWQRCQESGWLKHLPLATVTTHFSLCQGDSLPWDNPRSRGLRGDGLGPTTKCTTCPDGANLCCSQGPLAKTGGAGWRRPHHHVRDGEDDTLSRCSDTVGTRLMACERCSHRHGHSSEEDAPFPRATGVHRCAVLTLARVVAGGRGCGGLQGCEGGSAGAQGRDHLHHAGHEYMGGAHGATALQHRPIGLLLDVNVRLHGHRLPAARGVNGDLLVVRARQGGTQVPVTCRLCCPCSPRAPPGGAGQHVGPGAGVPPLAGTQRQEPSAGHKH
jgi:hypothetical protein